MPPWTNRLGGYLVAADPRQAKRGSRDGKQARDDRREQADDQQDRQRHVAVIAAEFGSLGFSGFC